MSTGPTTPTCPRPAVRNPLPRPLVRPEGRPVLLRYIGPQPLPQVYAEELTDRA
ncbi:hypothetical protein [Streptomyces sp. NPDC091278]|uniref:hypothetical protein n=1 Tax=Streptomyces sp. NPDC091278 TaxID=3155301 RepID=UPI00344F6314